MMAVYRSMKASDTIGVYALMNSNLDRPTPIEMIEYFLSMWPEGQFVAEDLFGNIVGAICGTRSVGGMATISLYAVDAKCRGQGIGTGLLDRFKTECWMQGYGSVQLELRVTNTKAYAFYQRHGFRLTEKVPDLYGPGEDGFRMIAMVSEINRASS